jgi:hypothetical protein
MGASNNNYVADIKIFVLGGGGGGGWEPFMLLFLVALDHSKAKRPLKIARNARCSRIIFSFLFSTVTEIFRLIQVKV